MEIPIPGKNVFMLIRGQGLPRLGNRLEWNVSPNDFILHLQIKYAHAS